MTDLDTELDGLAIAEHLAVSEPIEEGDPDLLDIPENTASIPEEVRRMLRSVARRRHEMARVYEQAEAMREEACLPIDEWEARERKRLDTSFLEERLAAFHQAWLADHPKDKTIDGPGARIKSITRDRWEWLDEAATIAYLEASAPELLQVRPTIRKADVKRHAHVDPDGQVRLGGEAIPGVAVALGETDFTVVVADGTF